MAKKGSAPAAPDYGPLMQASEKSAEYSYKIAQDQLDWAKTTYADNKAVGDQVIDFALGQMDKQAAWADADRKRYEDIYQPLEEQAAQRAQDYLTPQRQEYEAGKAEADVANQFRQARQTAQDRLESFGVDPSQTRGGALDLQSRIAEAAAQSSAGNQARFRTEQYADQLMANVINTGKGYPQQVLAAAGQAGQSGNQATNTGLATTASGANTMGTGYQWQGMGNQGLGMWGQMLNAGFQNKLASWQADQDSSSGWGGIIGTVAGTFLGGPAGGALGGAVGGATGWAEGGAIPDDTQYFQDGGQPDDSMTIDHDPNEGRYLPPEMSASGGAIEDDIPAEISGSGRPAQLNAGEFIMPKDVTSWLGEKGMQNLILKARKEMTGANGERPAQPEQGPPQGQQPQIPPRGVGAIPEMEGAI